MNAIQEAFQHVTGAKKRRFYDLTFLMKAARTCVGEAQESSSGPPGAAGMCAWVAREQGCQRTTQSAIPARPGRATTLATVLAGVESTTDRTIPVPARQENRENS
jgi:hypothetical protein